MMDQDSLNALRQAKPSFLADGLGLFPNIKSADFQDYGPARVIRSDSQATIIRQDSPIPDAQPPVPYNPPPNPPLCFGFGQGNLTLVLSGVSLCPAFSDSTDPNGTYALPFSSSGTSGSGPFCIWSLDTGIFNLSFTAVSLTGGGFEITVAISDDIDNVNYYQGFQSSGTFPSSLPNTITACVATDFRGSGGSATFSF